MAFRRSVGPPLLANFSPRSVLKAPFGGLCRKDVYGREQDLEGLQATSADVSIATRPGGGREVALFFGIRDRGESVTTGSDQGVIIDSDWVADLVCDLFESRTTGTKLFSVSRETVWADVLRACDSLSIPRPGRGLHLLRHTGAATDLSSRRRTDLELIRRRGRWVSLTSVQRYTDTAALVADLASLPAHVRDRGRAFLQSPAIFASRHVSARVRFSPGSM